MLTRRFQLVIIALLAFVVVVVWWAFQPWSDHQALVTPADVSPKTASFRCSAPFDGEAVGELEGDEPEYPLSREPCRDHGQRRALAIADLGVGAVAGVVVVRIARRSKANAAT